MGQEYVVLEGDGVGRHVVADLVQEPVLELADSAVQLLDGSVVGGELAVAAPLRLTGPLAGPLVGPYC